MSHPALPLPTGAAPHHQLRAPHGPTPLSALQDAGIHPLQVRLARLTAEQAADPRLALNHTPTYVHPLLQRMLHDDDHLAALAAAVTADMVGVPCLWRQLVMVHLDLAIWHACLEEYQNWKAAGLTEYLDWACTAGLIEPQHEPLFVRWVASTLWSRQDPVSDKPDGHGPDDARVALAVAVCAFSALEDPDAAFGRFQDLIPGYLQDYL